MQERPAPRDPLLGAGTPEYAALAGAVRRLLDVVVDARLLPPTQLLDTTRELDRVSSALEGARDALARDRRNAAFDGQRVPMPSWRYEHLDGSLVAHGEFSNGHTGPPGTVHGGWVAFAFDQILGWAVANAGFPGMTGKLTVRYRRPTPVGVPVEMEVPPPAVSGRRVHARATLHARGEVTAEADGLFVHFRRRDARTRA